MLNGAQMMHTAATLFALSPLPRSARESQLQKSSHTCRTWARYIGHRVSPDAQEVLYHFITGRRVRNAGDATGRYAVRMMISRYNASICRTPHRMIAFRTRRALAGRSKNDAVDAFLPYISNFAVAARRRSPIERSARGGAKKPIAMGDVLTHLRRAGRHCLSHAAELLFNARRQAGARHGAPLAPIPPLPR